MSGGVEIRRRDCQGGRYEINAHSGTVRLRARQPGRLRAERQQLQRIDPIRAAADDRRRFGAPRTISPRGRRGPVNNHADARDLRRRQRHRWSCGRSAATSSSRSGDLGRAPRAAPRCRRGHQLAASAWRRSLPGPASTSADGIPYTDGLPHCVTAPRFGYLMRGIFLANLMSIISRSVPILAVLWRRE